MKEMTEFYAVMSGINFTLLGLWWVAVQERPNLHGGRPAYMISLQFVIPGTAALLSQVAPQVPELWRTAFVVAGISGGAGILLMAPRMAQTGGHATGQLLLWAGTPLYALIAVVAALPWLGVETALWLTGPQWEGILFCLLALLGAQTAWTIAMTPAESAKPAARA